MARFPEVPEELRSLRVVMNSTREDDPHDDLELAHYRGLLEKDPKWITDRRTKLEREYRDECKEWRKEQSRRSAKKKAAAKGVMDIGTEKCLAMLDKLIVELAGGIK